MCKALTINVIDLGIRPTTFIPPLNEFNADTVTAMITESMDIMSPSCMWDTGGKKNMNISHLYLFFSIDHILKSYVCQYKVYLFIVLRVQT